MTKREHPALHSLRARWLHLWHCRAIGALCLYIGAMSLNALRSIHPEQSPTSFGFALLSLPLLVLGWRVFARRYWAGSVVALAWFLGELDFLTGPARKTPLDAVILLVFVSLVASLIGWRKQWIDKI